MLLVVTMLVVIILVVIINSYYQFLLFKLVKLFTKHLNNLF